MLTQMTGSRMIWMVHRAHLNVRVASDKHEEEGGGLIYIYIDIYIYTYLNYGNFSRLHSTDSFLRGNSRQK